MKILITGANGYIGQRVTHALLAQGHQLVCCVRDKSRFDIAENAGRIDIIETDFDNLATAPKFPADIDAAYFLIHSMAQGKGFEDQEKKVARNFLALLEQTRCQQLIYLSGIVNEQKLSAHLSSRLAVEKILSGGKIPTTVLRAGIVVGSGSSSFEIIRDLVEKLPVMVTPKWVETQCQPIGVRNVIEFLTGVLLKEQYYHQHYDIGGTDVLTYKEMLLQFAEARKLKRKIYTVPVMTPKLSSYWLYFVTSTSYPLAAALVDSMKVNVICQPNHLAEELGIKLLSYRESVDMAFQKIEQNEVVSSWKDAFSAFNTNTRISKNVDPPQFGCFKDVKTRDITGKEQYVFDNIWTIGGEKGWFYGNSLWRARGFLDKAFGGVGLRRGRTHRATLHPGDSLDFWRVLIADKTQQRLLLYAEMRLPGEAWLEFKAEHKDGKTCLRQAAIFRPRGIAGRLYWYSVWPFHYFIFNGMIDNLVKQAKV